MLHFDATIYCAWQLINPHTHEAFVLPRVDHYKKLTEELFDDSPWTRDELQAIARHTAERAVWDGVITEALEFPKFDT